MAKPIANAAELFYINLESNLKVKEVPNPIRDGTRFNLVSTVSGIGVLVFYNVPGQKVGTVFQDYVQPGKELTREYNVPSDKRSTLIYVFKVGDQSARGKLIGLK